MGGINPNQLSQDKDFLGMSPQDQAGYLSSQDPDFAKMSPADQAGYISHLTGKPAQTTLAPNAGLAPPAGAPKSQAQMETSALGSLHADDVSKALAPATTTGQNLLEGAGAGGISTLEGAYNLEHKIPLLGKYIAPRSPEEVKAGLEPFTATQGPAQKIGFGGEQVGEFMAAPEDEAAGVLAKIPGLAKLAAVAPKTATAIPKILAGAATGGAMNTLHGGDFSTGAEYGGGGSLLNEAIVQPALKAAAEYIPQRLMNAVARTSPKGFNYGRNPGQGLAEEGLMASSQGSMLSKINDRLAQTGQAIESHLSDPAVNKPVVDITKAVTGPIDEMEAAAIKGKNLDLADRLRDLRTRLTNDFVRDQNGKLVPSGPTRLSGLTPSEANAIKQDIGKMTRWTGDPKVDEMTPAIQQIYARINGEIEKAAPGIKQINNRYGELKSASDSLDNKIRLKSSYNPVGSLTDMLSALKWGSPGYIGSKVLRSTPGMSVAAQAARNAPQGMDLIRRAATGVAVSGGEK